MSEMRVKADMHARKNGPQRQKSLNRTGDSSVRGKSCEAREKRAFALWATARQASLVACRAVAREASEGWWAREDSNLQPSGYEPLALTIELRAR
jgi:hypothetical protein